MKKLFVRLVLVLAGFASDSVNVAWQPALPFTRAFRRPTLTRSAIKLRSSFGHGAAERKDPLGGRRSGVDRCAQTDKGDAQGVALREEVKLIEASS